MKQLFSCAESVLRLKAEDSRSTIDKQLNFPRARSHEIEQAVGGYRNLSVIFGIARDNGKKWLMDSPKAPSALTVLGRRHIGY